MSIPAAKESPTEMTTWLPRTGDFEDCWMKLEGIRDLDPAKETGKVRAAKVMAAKVPAARALAAKARASEARPAARAMECRPPSAEEHPRQSRASRFALATISASALQHSRGNDAIAANMYAAPETARADTSWQSAAACDGERLRPKMHGRAEKRASRHRRQPLVHALIRGQHPR